MAKLNFKATSKGRALKVTPSKYRESAGRPNISQSDGIRPAFPLMPWEGLSDKVSNYQDITTEDNIVIPKGKIVSALTSNTDMGAAYDDGNIYGVGKGVMGLMVPANGGAARTFVAGTTLPANIPIGVAEHDVYEYLGKNPGLNYQTRNKNWGVLCHQLIKLPSIDVDAFDLFFGAADHFMDTSVASENEMYEGANDFATSIQDADAAYYKMDGKWSWLTVGGDGVAGKMLRADFYGNWMIANDNGSDGAQVAGKLMGIDYRMNKDLMDTVQSKYDAAAYRTSGTGTMGVPQFLYDYSYDAIDWAIKGAGLAWATNAFDVTVNYGTEAACVAGNGTWSGGNKCTMAGEDPAKIIYEATEAGVFGEAWILVNI